MSEYNKQEISRRDFLKMSGIGLSAFFGEPIIKKLEISEPYSESKNTVLFRKDRVMTVNKDPVFPLGLYYLPGPEKPDSWQKISEAGLNTISQWWVNENNLLLAEKYGINTMAFLPYAFPDEDKYGSVDIGVLDMLRKSKSFIGYYGGDEPDLTLSRSLYSNLLRDLGRMDPQHPDMAVFAENPNIADSSFYDIREYKIKYKGHPDDLSGLPDYITDDLFKFWYIEKSGTEIVSFDYYHNSSIDDIVSVGKVVEKYIHNLRSGKFGTNAKSVWVTLSAHSEAPLTLESMRFQAIDVIARGATGVFWWDWPPGCSKINCTGYPEKGNGYFLHWDKLQSISGELDLVKDGLEGQELFLGVSQSGSVAYKVSRSRLGRHYVFAACESSVSNFGRKETISVNFPNKRFHVLGEGREVISDEKGNLVDDFGPLGSRIYVSDKSENKHIDRLK